MAGATAIAWAGPKTSTTTLAVTSGGVAVTTVASGSAVTLTATVLVGGAPFVPGQVNFCDATASFCTDVHLLGTAQLTLAGTASISFVPGLGKHSYYATFAGVNGVPGSTSSTSALAVTGVYPTASILAFSGSPGNYTLSDTVTASGSTPPTGTVSILDETNAGYVLATPTLVPSTVGVNFHEYALPPAPGTPRAIIAADFNNDGTQDLAVADYTSNNLSILLGTPGGGGGFTTPSLGSPATGFAPIAIATGDFDGDGFPDLVVANYGDGTISVLHNDQTGNFAGQIISVGAQPDAVVVGDFNKDGNADIAVASSGAGLVTILLGNGDGTFKAPTTVNVGNALIAMATGDFNNDGIPDLAVTNSTTNAVTILLGNGDGTFTVGSSVPTGATPRSIAVADFNGDGLADLVIVNQTGSSVTVLLGNGKGGFSVATSPTGVGITPNFVAIGDFNQDGIPDFAITTTLNGYVQIFLGNGDGTFTFADNLSTTLTSTPPAPDAVAVADFNGDGIPDVAAADSGNNNVYVFQTGGASSVAIAMGISPVGTGNHTVEATYGGAALYGPSTSNTVSLVAEKVVTATALAANPPSIGFGNQVTFTATITPTPVQNHSVSGTVTFKYGAIVLGTGPVSTGQATFSTSGLPAGVDCITAVYNGDTNFLTSTSAQLCYQVDGNALQTITFPQPPSPAYAGTSATLTATSSSGLPVTYSVVSGPATVNGSTLIYTGLGTVVVEADAAGNATYAPAAPVQRTVSVVVLTEPVGTTSPTLTAIVTINTAGTLGAIDVLTQGAPNLDFNMVAGGTCTVGTAYTAGQNCTVELTMTPTHPGPRLGGITLATPAGALLANSYVFGQGTGPQVIFTPGMQSVIGSGFDAPNGVAVDGSGNVYVSDMSNNAVEEIPAGGGPVRLLANFALPDDVAVDGSGNVFVIWDRTTLSEIVAVNGVIPASPTIRTLATGYASLDGMKVDANGNAFLADGAPSSGSVTTGAVYEVEAVNGVIPASPTIRELGFGTFNAPTGVAIDLSGDVFVSDQNNSAVYEIVAVNGVIPSSPSINKLGSGFSIPTNVALDGIGDVFVPDYGNNKVYEMLAVNGSIPASPTILTLGTGFSEPEGIIVDGNGNVYVADAAFTTIAKLDYADAPTLTFDTTQVGQTSVDSPQTVTFENDGNMPLVYASPVSDPTITPGFTIGATSTCQQNVISAPPVPFSLASGASCTDVISYTPVAVGPTIGALVTTDNNLNVANATQTVVLIGAGTGIPPTITFTVPNHTVGDPPFTVTAMSNSTGVFTYTVINGPATISGNTVTLTGAGTVVLEACQPAAGIYLAGCAEATFLVALESQTINFIAPATPVGLGAPPITLVATATSGLPVTFSILSGPASVSGSTLTFLGQGTIVVAADQAGNSSYGPAPEVTHTIVVTPGTPTVALTATPNPVFILNPVTLVASVSGSVSAITPGGTVIFSDGTTPLGTAPVSGGVATLVVPSLTFGSHTITAAYSGDTNYMAGVSNVVVESVQDFGVSFIGNTGPTVIHGQSATFAIDVTSLGGPTLPAGISFGLTGAPIGSIIGFSPVTLAAGSGSSQIVVTILTPDYPSPASIPASLGVSGTGRTTAVAALLAMVGWFVIFRRRRPLGQRMRRLGCIVLLLAAAIGFASLSGCGSGWGTGTFNITVTGSSGPLSHSASATMIEH